MSSPSQRRDDIITLSDNLHISVNLFKDDYGRYEITMYCRELITKDDKPFSCWDILPVFPENIKVLEVRFSGRKRQVYPEMEEEEGTDFCFKVDEHYKYEVYYDDKFLKTIEIVVPRPIIVFKDTRDDLEEEEEEN